MAPPADIDDPPLTSQPKDDFGVGVINQLTCAIPGFCYLFCTTFALRTGTTVVRKQARTDPGFPVTRKGLC